MSITPKTNDNKHDEQGYELDENGQRIYPIWAAFIPEGAKRKSAARPPWVPEIANYWDDSKPPRGWYRLKDGGWGNALDEEHVAEHPELLEMLQKDLDATRAKLTDQPKPEDAPPVTVRCTVCDKPFDNAKALRMHAMHHKLTDQRHKAVAEAAKE